MIRLAVSVEGQTERAFVKQVLVERLSALGIWSQPILLGGTGGNISVDRLANDTAKLAYNFNAVTSLVDYYGFRNNESLSVTEMEETICLKVRQKIAKNRQHSIFPYVQLYEFEGLLFSDPLAIAHVVRASAEQFRDLTAIGDTFDTPEAINDDSSTAPIKRLKSVLPAYNKVLHGPQIVKRATIDVILRKCPRFRGRIERLETLRERI